MKLLHKAIFCVAVATVLTGCEMKNELIGNDTDKRETGTLELGVAVKLPLSQTRTTVETDDFPVTVEGIGTDVADIKNVYESVNEMPTSITLPVGNYKVTAHSPGELQRQMTQPYYGGEATMEIKKGLTTETKVECKMKNSRVQMNYGQDFLGTFSAWTITINDGNNKATAFTSQNINPQAIYWAFDEGVVTALTVDISATLTTGGTIQDSKTFVKASASESYDDVSDFFEGGDAIEINMGTASSASGDLTGITITTNITFENKDEVVEIPVEKTTPPTEPTTGDPKIVLPDDISFSIKDTEEEDFAIEADALITATKGIKTMVVRIESGCDDFTEALIGLRDREKDPIDFINGEDLVNNTRVKELLTSVGQPINVPALEDPSYTFPIGNFFSFLAIAPTDSGKMHQFHITVTDIEGNTATGTYKVTITEE